MPPLPLDDLRGSLIRQEETIIFALIERAQFKLNPVVYQPGAFQLGDFAGSFSDYLLFETEKVHARVRRYTSPDEHPFFADLPAPILPPIAAASPIKRNAINLNPRIRQLYLDHLLPAICAPGDDQNYGSSAVCDVACLQALSKRIHYGKFIAEAKFQGDVDTYTALIQARDAAGLLQLLTHAAVEEKLLRRVAAKAAAYGQEIDPEAQRTTCKIEARKVAALYADWIIPLTKEVEVLYLLGRLDEA
jgi:chorismate mutase